MEERRKEHVPELHEEQFFEISLELAGPTISNTASSAEGSNAGGGGG